MLLGDEEYRYFQNIYCCIKWILVFILFFTLDPVIYSNLEVFGHLTGTLSCIGVWNGILYYLYKKSEKYKKISYNLSVLELIVDILSVTYLAKVQASYGDGFIYIIFLVLLVMTFVRFGASVVTYILVPFIIGNILFIYSHVYKYSYILKYQKIAMTLILTIGVCFVMYLVIKENRHLKMLVALKEADVKDLEKNVRQLKYLSDLSAIVYRSNEFDTIIVHLLENIYKFTQSEGIGLILYGENNVESDARLYTYRDVKHKKNQNQKQLVYQPFYAQIQLQNIREYKAYKNCILFYEPITSEKEDYRIIEEVLPGTNKKYMYLFNLLQGDTECGMIVCNTSERLSAFACRQIDELIKYAGFAFLKVQLLEDERYKAMYDMLTGAKSRRYLNEMLPEMVKKSHMKNEPIGIIFCDIDHFKYFNDNYGHHLGDLVLKEVVRIMEDRMSKESLVGRYGGEEFIGLIENGNEKKTYEIAENIRQGIEVLSLEEYTREDTHITISIGIAIYSKGSYSIEEVIKFADTAMYKAKENRNKVCLYEK